jgi:hypothetical protein
VNLIHDEDVAGISAYKIAKILGFNEITNLFDDYLKMEKNNE